MDTPKYLIWESRAVPNVCTLDELRGFEDTLELNKGVPWAAKFPADVAFTMHPDFPNNTLLGDNLINNEMLLVVSKRLKEFLEARALPKVEYLQVTIVNHKGRPASRDYFIVHPVDPVDCLDLAKCQAKISRIDGETVQRLKQLALDEARLDPDRQLFRPKFYYDIALARTDLAAAIDAAGFTGIRWVEPEDHPIPRPT
jgi:hypothetical protein